MTPHYWQVQKMKTNKGETVYIVAESNSKSAFIDRKDSVIVEADVRTSDAKILELAKDKFKEE